MAHKTEPIHLDQKYIIGLVNGDTKIIKDIYQLCYPDIESHVTKNNGSKDDAKDLFSESLKIIYLQGKDGLQLKSSFQGYLFRICQRRWINKLKRRQKFAPDIENQKEPEADHDFFESQIEAEKILLFRKHISQLPDRCRQILELTFEQFNYREISEKLQLNYSYLRRAAGVCIENLTTAVKNDPIYQELISE